MVPADLFWNTFYGIVALCIAVHLYTRRPNKDKSKVVSAMKPPPGFKQFQRSFLAVTLLAMLADWLQGPYVYKLYHDYGYDQGDIGLLFVAGFLSSAIFGTIAGGMADVLGRKKACQAYALVYIVTALTKLSPNFSVLFFGRITGGLATSLLFTSFESWMVSEHFKRNYPEELLPETFSYLTLGNGITAVAAGIIAQHAANAYGSVAPFIVCIIPLAILFVLVSMQWTENYGAEGAAGASGFSGVFKEVTKGIKEGFVAIHEDKKLFFLGGGQTCFEAGMYTFVFMWTPALQANPKYSDAVAGSLGLIFATFMVCTMTGSGIFGKLADDNVLGVSRVPFVVHGLAMLSCLSPALLPLSTVLMLMSFMLLEICVGMFYPAYGTMRGMQTTANPGRVFRAWRSSTIDCFRQGSTCRRRSAPPS